MLSTLIDADTRTMLGVILGDFAARIVHVAAFVIPALVSVRAAAALERKPRSFSPGREAVLAVFVLYLVIVAAATIVPLQPSAVSGVGTVSFVPGRSIVGCYRQMKGPVELVICNMQVLGNIFLFVPFGLLLPLVWFRLSSARTVLGSAFVASVTIEVVQYLQQSMGMKRSVDIDDVILNVVGALIGYLLIRFWQGSDPRAPFSAR